MDHTKHHLLRKFYNREIYGSFDRRRKVILDKAVELFTSVPERLVYPLYVAIHSMKKQIYLGASRCGQFLITYSFQIEISQAPLAFRYRYTLHWWVYRPASRAVKVAEVQLFDSQDIKNVLSIGIAQWPKVNNKLIVYGYCEDGDAPYEQEDADMETRRYYITVTTLPSLHNCKNCKSVAESFDEEEMAANWDRAISMSCLKHGLTIHTILEIAPPYPALDFLTNLKIDNKIIVNTGNFLHVLAFSNDQQDIKPSVNDTIVTEELHHKIGEKLSSDDSVYKCPWKTKSSFSRKMMSHSVNKAWLNTIMAKAEEAYAFEETEDGCEPRFKWYRRRKIADKMYEFCSDDENMENICPPKKLKRFSSPSNCLVDKKQECRLVRWDNNGEEDNRSSTRIISTGERNLAEHCKCFKLESTRTKSNDVDKKMKCKVPINNCDNDVFNNCDDQDIDIPSCVKGRSTPPNNLTNYCDTFSNKSNEPLISSPVSSPVSDDSNVSKYDLYKKSLNVSILKPNVTEILTEWDVDSVSSLSPVSSCCCVCKNKDPKSLMSPCGSLDLSQESGADADGPSSHYSNRKCQPMLVVLRPRNCNQDVQKFKEPEDKGKSLSNEEMSVKPMKDIEFTIGQRMISGCSVQFDRIYIEVDEETMSTITDIEDDDQGTGYHCALPLSVHGSAYTQLQMISNQKAERMNIHCERVYQCSLDIDQFCFKAGEIICKCEGLKFWFCHDYDVEIIDVCALNGDILGVLCLRLNAEEELQKTERHNEVNDRFFYEVSCVFTWNPKKDRCWLEAYTRLENVYEITETQWAPAKNEASKLRQSMLSFSHSSLDFHPPIRNFTHHFYSSTTIVPSLQKMRDLSNLIGFDL